MFNRHDIGSRKTLRKTLQEAIEMPTLNDVASVGHELIEAPSIPWLARAIPPGLIRGAVYLLAGEPGIGKTTLALQLLGDLALQGRKVLYVTTEQGLGDLSGAMKRIHGTPDGKLPDKILANFFLEDKVDDLDSLPRFLARRVLTEGEEYHGVQTVVLDS